MFAHGNFTEEKEAIDMSGGGRWTAHTYRHNTLLLQGVRPAVPSASKREKHQLNQRSMLGNNRLLLFRRNKFVKSQKDQETLLDERRSKNRNNQRQHIIWDLFKHFLNWCILDLQHHVSSRCTEKWFRYIYIYTLIIYFSYLHFINILFHILFHYRLLQDTEYSFLCYIVGSCCLSHM